MLSGMCQRQKLDNYNLELHPSPWHTASVSILNDSGPSSGHDVESNYFHLLPAYYFLSELASPCQFLSSWRLSFSSRSSSFLPLAVFHFHSASLNFSGKKKYSERFTGKTLFKKLNNAHGAIRGLHQAFLRHSQYIAQPSDLALLYCFIGIYFWHISITH